VNFLIENWMLVTVAVASALALFWPTLSQGAAGGVAPTDAVLLINREKAVLIDVCEPHEFAQGHAIGSKNIPLAQLEAQLPNMVKTKACPSSWCAKPVAELLAPPSKPKSWATNVLKPWPVV
jgi:hypothetical protein